MILGVYTIHDSAIQSHGQPFFARANGEAMRIFQDEATNRESKINKHAKDFDLYKVAEYNDEDATITTETPIRLARASDYKEVTA